MRIGAPGIAGENYSAIAHIERGIAMGIV